MAFSPRSEPFLSSWNVETVSTVNGLSDLSRPESVTASKKAWSRWPCEHCGDLGHELNEKQLAAVKGCDALLIPVGGYYTIDAKTAKKVADAIAPRVLVPMHYRFGAHGYPEIGTLDEFLALYEAKKIHKLDGNSFELTKNAPAGVIVPRFAE